MKKISLRAISLFFLTLFATVTLLGQTVIHHDISTGNLVIPGNSPNHYRIYGTSVANGSAPVPAIPATYSYSPEWVVITFDTPFQYNGGNLVVGVLNNTGSYLSSNNTFNTSPGTGNQTLHYYTDGALIDPLAPPTGYLTTSRANTRFCIQPGTSGPCTDRTVGTGTSGTYQLPINTYYRYSYVQHIFTQAEIGATGYITSIAFQYTYLQQTKGPLTIYLGHTAKNVFASSSDWVTPSMMQQVFKGNKTFVSNSQELTPYIPAVPAVVGVANVVTIQSGYQGTVTLDNLHIKTTPNAWRSGSGAGYIATDGRSGVSCITVEGEFNRSNTNPITKVNFILKGDNILEFASDSYCAIQVNQGAQIHINSIDPEVHTSGTLWAECSAPADGSSGGGAAIGAPNFSSPGYGGQGFASQIYSRGNASCPTHLNTAGGNIIISSGKVTAIGGHGAGIGGGWYTWYDGFIIITNGVIVADCKRHSAGIGSGCPNGSGVLTNCYTANSAIIALPPCEITSFGRIAETGPPMPDLALAGSNFLSYVNDPAKPRMNIRTVDYEPYAPIFLDLKQIQGLLPIFNQIFPSFDLGKVKIGNTNAIGNIPLHGLFQEPVTFFTTVSSTRTPTCGIGVPYRPVTETNMNGHEIVLPCMGVNITMDDQWGYPLCTNYTAQDALNDAYHLKITNTTGVNQTNLTFTLQDGANSKFNLTFFNASHTQIAQPTSLANNTTIYVRASLKATGLPIGTHYDFLTITGTSGTNNWTVRKMVRHRVIDCSFVACPGDATNGSIRVSTETGKASFQTTYPVGPTVGTIPLYLKITLPEPPTYDPAQIYAYYTITKESTFAGARAEKEPYLWTPCPVPQTNGGTAFASAQLSGLTAGTYYIHWFVGAGNLMANSGTATNQPDDCAGFGPYIITGQIDPGTISGPTSVCSGNPAALTGTAASGGTPIAYQWQFATSSGGPWLDITGATSQNLSSTGNLTTATYYRRQVTIAGVIHYSNTIMVSIINTTTPTFNFANNFEYCAGAGNPPMVSFPNTSSNGIAGAWTPSATLPTTAGNYTYTFTPTPIAGCSGTSVQVFIKVNANVTPTFPTIPTVQCYNTGSYSLPQPNNTPAITGTWNAPDYIPTNILGLTTTYTFTPTPNAGQCISGANPTVTIRIVGSTIDNFTYTANNFPCVQAGQPNVSHRVFDLKGTYNANAATNSIWTSTVALPAGFTRTFSVSPAGSLLINPTTGELTITPTTTPGTYNVSCSITYTASGCTTTKTIPITVDACQPVLCDALITHYKRWHGQAPSAEDMPNPICYGPNPGTDEYVPIGTGLVPGGLYTLEREDGEPVLWPAFVFGDLSPATFAVNGRMKINKSIPIPAGMYIITYTQPAPNQQCSTSFKYEVLQAPTVNPFSIPTVTFCEGNVPASQTNPITITVTGTNRYQGGVFSSGPGLNIISTTETTCTIDLATSTAGTYKLSYTTPGTPVEDCYQAVTREASGTITILSATLPAQRPITGPDVLCYNDSKTFSVPKVQNASNFQWTISGTGWTITSGATSQNVTVKAPAKGTGGAMTATLSVVQSSVTPGSPPTTCATTAAVTKIISIVEPPTMPTLALPLNICSGQPVTFTLEGTESGVSYTWQGGGTGVTWSPTGANNVNNSSFNATLTVNNFTTAAPTITITATNGICPISQTFPIPMSIVWPGTVSQPNAITALPNTQYPCTNTSTTYSITGTNVNTVYEWQVPLGWTITNPPGVTSNTVQGVNLSSITVTTGSDGGFILVRAKTACAISAWRDFRVEPTTPPTHVTLYGPSSPVCLADAGKSFELRATYLQGVTYQWQYTNITGPATSATEVVTASFATPPANAPGKIGTAQVRATTTNCGSSPWSNIIELEIIGHYDLNNLLTSDTTVCKTTGLNIDLRNFVKFIIPPRPGDHVELFFWTQPTPGSFTAVSYPIINTIPGTITYWVSAVAHDVCESIGKLPITITYVPPVTPQVTVSASPGNTVCSGSTITFTATPSGGGTAPFYQWVVDGTNIGVPTTNNSFPISTLSVGNHTISCVMVSNAICANPTTVNSNPVQVTVEPLPVKPTDITNSVTGIICPNTSITLTANGGSGGQYQWGTGTNCGSNIIPAQTGATYTVVPPVGTTTFWVRRAGSGSCSTQYSACETIEVTITDNVTPSVNITSSPAPATVCAGTSVTFTATPTNGGTPSYQWKVGGTNVGTNDNSYTYTPTNGDVVTCVMTSTANCPTPNPVTSNAITVTVEPLPVKPTDITNSVTGIICPNTSITLTANGGSGGLYQWGTGTNCGSNIIPAQTGATYTVVPPVGTTTFWVRRAGSGSCSTQYSACETIEVTITDNVTPSVNITSSPAPATVCAGTSVTFTATPTNGGTPSYQWKVGGTNVGTNDNSYTYTPTNGDVVTCVMTSTANCPSPNPVTSNAITVTVEPLPVKPADITNSVTGVICPNTSITLTANGGSGGLYQWGTGTNCGSNIIPAQTGATYTVVPPVGTTTFWVRRAGSGSCSTQYSACETIEVTITDNVTPSVSITSSPAPATVCAGTSVTFTATPTNGGTPSYQWKVGGTNVGTNDNSYTYTPTNGDVVTCVITSTANCLTSNPVTSNAITVTVASQIPPPAGYTNVGLFCSDEDVTVADLKARLPEAGIKIYLPPSTIPLEDAVKLVAGTYFATSTVGTCESMDSLHITVSIYNEANANITADPTNILDETITTIELEATGGTEYAWTYSDGTNPATNAGTSAKMNINKGGTYSVTVTDQYGCAATASMDIKVTVIGTVFPFVRWNVPEVDALFSISATLRPYPTSAPNVADLIALKSSTPLGKNVVYYDGTIFVDGTPIYGGFVGSIFDYNYYDIDWPMLLNSPKTPPPPQFLAQGVAAAVHGGTTVGLYKIATMPGMYVLELQRDGFITRWAKVEVGTGNVHYERHREIIPGDDDNDLNIDIEDETSFMSHISDDYNVDEGYLPQFDLNADGRIDLLDYNIIIEFQTFEYLHYRDTKEWIEGY